jgi:hypothetical protein
MRQNDRTRSSRQMREDEEYAGSDASPLSEETNVHPVSRSEARWYLVEPASCFSFLIEHDHFRKTATRFSGAIGWP